MADEKPMDPATEKSAPEAAKTAEPVTPQAPPSSAPVPEVAGGGGKRVGLIVALVLVLATAAVVAGFVSARRSRQSRVGEESSITPEVTAEDTMTTQYEQVSDSDEIVSIESDLQSTSFDGIDKELAEIDKELSKEE